MKKLLLSLPAFLLMMFVPVIAADALTVNVVDQDTNLPIVASINACFDGNCGSVTTGLDGVYTVEWSDFNQYVVNAHGYETKVVSLSSGTSTVKLKNVSPCVLSPSSACSIASATGDDQTRLVTLELTLSKDQCTSPVTVTIDGNKLGAPFNDAVNGWEITKQFPSYIKCSIVSSSSSSVQLSCMGSSAGTTGSTKDLIDQICSVGGTMGGIVKIHAKEAVAPPATVSCSVVRAPECVGGDPVVQIADFQGCAVIYNCACPAGTKMDKGDCVTGASVTRPQVLFTFYDIETDERLGGVAYTQLSFGSDFTTQRENFDTAKNGVSTFIDGFGESYADGKPRTLVYEFTKAGYHDKTQTIIISQDSNNRGIAMVPQHLPPEFNVVPVPDQAPIQPPGILPPDLFQGISDLIQGFLDFIFGK